MMGVIFIGDRFSGKTHLAMELSNPSSKFVTASVIGRSYESLKALLYDESSGGTKPTDINPATYNRNSRSMNVQVTLPMIGNRSIDVDWIDTPGEIWRPSWQTDNPSEWQSFLAKMRDSEGIMLILSPHREQLKPESEEDEYITKKQWMKRFENWVNFFQKEGPNVKRVAICLNKVDLILDCDVGRESAQLAYDPYQSRMTWQQRHGYVVSRYLRPIQPQLEQINHGLIGGSICCFITTVHNRTLLELPWIYLASYLAV